MRPPLASRRSLKHALSTYHIANPQSIGELSSQYGPDRWQAAMMRRCSAGVSYPPTRTRHGFEQREADREREAHRLNPRDAWEI